MSKYDTEKGATISECGKYRFELWRTWDAAKPKVMFVMLNPSTADGMEDDPTIRRCVGFAKSWGYGGIMVGNLFAYRCTDPKELKKNPGDVQDKYNADQNNQHIMSMFYEAAITVCAWGNSPIEPGAPPLWGASNLHYLELSKSGNPKHPLYLKGSLTPTKYEFKKYI